MAAPDSVRQTGGGRHPLQPDEMMSVWHSPDSGTFEWICGPTMARDLLNGGMQAINGQPCRVEVVDIWPELKGVHVRATMTEPVQC